MGARAVFLSLLLLFLLATPSLGWATPKDEKAATPESKTASTESTEEKPEAPAVEPAPPVPEIIQLINAVVSVDDALAKADAILEAKRADGKLAAARLEELVEDGSEGQRWLALRNAELRGAKKAPLPYEALTSLFASREQRLLDLAVRLVS